MDSGISYRITRGFWIGMELGRFLCRQWNQRRRYPILRLYRNHPLHDRIWEHECLFFYRQGILRSKSSFSRSALWQLREEHAKNKELYKLYYFCTWNKIFYAIQGFFIPFTILPMGTYIRGWVYRKCKDDLCGKTGRIFTLHQHRNTKHIFRGGNDGLRT